MSTIRGAIHNPAGLDVDRLQSFCQEGVEDFLSRYEAADRIPPRQLLELPVDLLCPCARHHSIGNNEVSRIRTRLVVAGANNLVTPQAELELAKRGVLCLPDFVSNCGGVLGGTMEFAGFSQRRIEETLVHELGNCLYSLLQAANRTRRSPRELTTEYALQRMAQIQTAAAHSSLWKKTVDSFLRIYRQGWIPRSLLMLLSSNFFTKRLPDFSRQL